MARSYRRGGSPEYTRTITVHVKPTRFKRGGKLIARRGYTYKKLDLGKPGKGPKLIVIKEKGALTGVGYSTKKSEAARRRALVKAVDRYGALSVFKKLNAQYVFRKNYDPKTARIFEADRDWVRSQFKVDGFVT